MNAIPYVRVDKPELTPTVYACGKCKMLYSDGSPLLFPPGTKTAQDAAEACCGPYRCPNCAQPNGSHAGAWCSACSQEMRNKAAAAQEAKENRAALRAKRLTIAQYSGPVCAPLSDRFFSEVEEYLESCEDEGEQPEFPFVWPCHVRTLALNVGDALDSVLEAENVDGAEFSHVEELEAFVKEWNAKQTHQVWTAYESEVVVIDEGRFADMAAELGAESAGVTR